jgi:Leucine-rich repeat (LRR) protein
LSDNDLHLLGDQLHDSDITYNCLKKLRLSSNHLPEIPAAVFRFPALKELYLDKNSLNAISGDLPNLSSLDLFLNSLSQFPNLPESVISVNLGFNQIKSLSIHLPNLRELKLSGNDLPEISSDCLLPSLVLFDISFNRLVSLPPISSFAPKLEHLIVSFNFLSSFPTSFPVSIRKIDISHNCMSQWTDSLVNLTNLTYLDVRFNDFVSIPELPPGIEKFIADRNKLSDAVPITPLGLNVLNFNHFQNVPIFRDCRVTHLLMRHNALESIQPEFICPDIRLIDCTCNSISVIPIELFVFNHLTTVMLTHNAIREIPEAIVNSKIQSLFISDNPISSLPTLPDSLKEISASNCDFTELPPPLFNLPNLQTTISRATKSKSSGSFPKLNI